MIAQPIKNENFLSRVIIRPSKIRPCNGKVIIGIFETDRYRCHNLRAVCHPVRVPPSNRQQVREPAADHRPDGDIPQPVRRCHAEDL